MKKLLIVGLFISIVAAVTATRLNDRPVTTCVWPNPCSRTVTQIQPCVWPNHCFKSIAQVQPCVWPNKCVVAM